MNYAHTIEQSGTRYKDILTEANGEPDGYCVRAGSSGRKKIITKRRWLAQCLLE
jgi:hypothetical protein